MRRVLFVIGSMGGGGAERQVLHYIRFLDRTQFTPMLYLAQARGELLNQVPTDVRVLSYDGDRQNTGVYFPGKAHRNHVTHLARVLEDEQIDVACAVTFYASLVVGPAATRRPTRWLAVEMADPRLDFDQQTRRFRWIKRWLLRRAYRRSHLCVAVSSGVRDGMVLQYGIAPDNIAVLPNFIDVSQVKQYATMPGPELAPDTFHIVTVGRLHVQKGQRFLIDAFAQVVGDHPDRRLHLHILGQGPLETELRSQVVRLGIESHVTFVGFCDNPFAYMKRCQLFCLPSLFEGLPLSLLEAIACEVPVLATDCPSGPREVLLDGKYGTLVPPSDVQALYHAIVHAITSPAKDKSLTNAALQHVMTNYSVTTGIEKLQQLLRDVMSRPL